MCSVGSKGLNRPKATALPLSAGSLLPPFGDGQANEREKQSLNFLIFYFEDKGKPLREVKSISHCSMPFAMWMHWCNAAHFSAISDQQIQVHFTALWQSSSNSRDTSSCLSLLSRKQLQTHSSLLLHCMFTATTEPCTLSYQSPTEVWVLLGTFLLLGGLAMSFLCLPSLSTTLHFGGNNLLTGAHKGSNSFWKQAAQEELRATTNCSFATKSKTQSQPGLPVSHKHKERTILGESSQTGVRQIDPLGKQL